MKALLMRAAAVAMFLLCSQAIFGLTHQNIIENSLSGDDLTPASIFVTAAIYTLVLVALLFYLRSLPEMLLRAKLVLALPFFALLSVAWSQYPPLTIRRSLVLVFVSCIAACFGAIFSLREMARLVTVTSFMICVATFFLAVVAPSIVHDAARIGVWKGIFAHKNTQGGYMVLAFLTALHSRFQRWQIIAYATMFMSLVLLLLSDSSTSLVALIIVVAALPIRYLVRVPGKQFLVALTLFGTLTATAVYFLTRNYDAILAALGKNATLTGRTQIWTLVLDSIARHPLLGYGFNGFWLGLYGESLNIITAVGWLVPHAHNGLLDILLGVGIVGGLLFLLGLLRLLALLIQSLRVSGMGFPDFWPVSFLVALTVINATESQLLTPNGIFWFLYIAIFSALATRSAASPRFAVATASTYAPSRYVAVA